MKIAIHLSISSLFWIAAFQPAIAGPPSPEYKLIFSDDFDGDSIDLEKWKVSSEGPRKKSFVTSTAVKVDGEGNLVITMTKEDGKYKTGMVSTERKFEHRFGYFEARMKMPSAEGPHSAFWLHTHQVGKKLGDPKNSGVEIDVIEWLQKFPDTAFHTIHWDGYGPEHKKTVKEAKIRNPDRRFKVYGLEWTESGYRFFIDDKETAVIDGPVSEVPQFLILSLILADWGGEPNDRDFPDSLFVDYVKAYARQEEQ